MQLTGGAKAMPGFPAYQKVVGAALRRTLATVPKLVAPLSK